MSHEGGDPRRVSNPKAIHGSEVYKEDSWTRRGYTENVACASVSKGEEQTSAYSYNLTAVRDIQARRNCD